MSAWKDFERRVAYALGGNRSGPLGKHASDVAGIAYSVECKHTTRYSVRKAWIEQARRQARDEGKPWMLVVSEHGDRQPIAVVDLWWLTEILRERAERAA